MEVAARPMSWAVVARVVAAVREQASARLAAKVLLIVLLEEGNKETMVEASTTSTTVEAVATSERVGNGEDRDGGTGARGRRLSALSQATRVKREMRPAVGSSIG
jgi:hypothetical protein